MIGLKDFSQDAVAASRSADDLNKCIVIMSNPRMEYLRRNARSPLPVQRFVILIGKFWGMRPVLGDSELTS